MADEFIDLRSVNWTSGMFLTPEHFLREERYVDSLALWLLRHTSAATGLIGSGPRVEAAQRGAAAFDPIVSVSEDQDSLKVTVGQCRGLTPGGAIVDIAPHRSVDLTVPRADLAGVMEVGLFVVAKPHDKQVDPSLADAVNAQMPGGRAYRYAIELDVRAADAPWSLQVARLRRAEAGLRFEKVPGFIPPCALMLAHSELMRVYWQLNERVLAIADRYGALHRAIVQFIGTARSRGIDVEPDVETMAFVSHMVTTIEACAFELLDPAQPPGRYFLQINRLVRSAALFLSLSPPTTEYFRLLGDIGELDFVSFLEQEREALEMDRGAAAHEDLGTDAQRALLALERVDRLEQGLEGKYLDYRLSPSLEGINFVFDRTGGEAVLYRAVAKPARPMAHGQELTFVFAPLRLEAREQFRVILLGDRNASFAPTDRLTVELRVNPGEGYRGSPQFCTADVEVASQRNFAVDFRAPDDVVTISDLRVSLRSSQPIRGAILYVRGRLTGRALTILPSAQRPARPGPSPPPDRAPEPSSGAGRRRRLS